MSKIETHAIIVGYNYDAATQGSQLIDLKVKFVPDSEVTFQKLCDYVVNIDAIDELMEARTIKLTLETIDE
jgi:hypothetical protein